MNTVKKKSSFGAQDAAANRVYQAFERLQLAWYTVNNARHSVNGTVQYDNAAIVELEAAEEEWLAVRSALPNGC